MVQFRSWEEYDDIHSTGRRLLLVGNALTNSHFVLHCRLTPFLQLEYEGLCQSLNLLSKTESDIIVSYTSLPEICRVVALLEECDVKEGSQAYLYHKFDIKTGTYCDCCRSVYINGFLVVDGGYNFYRNGLNIEALTEDDFSLMKTAFKNSSLTKNELSAIKSDNCQITFKEGRAVRINTIDNHPTLHSYRDDILYVYLLGGCVWSSNYSTQHNKIKQVLQRLLNSKCADKYVVEHISNVGSNEKILMSLKHSKLHSGGIVFIGNITKPEVILAACRICEAQGCRAIVYLHPNILARTYLSPYERRIVNRGWGEDISELKENLKRHSELLDELSFLGVEAYEPPPSFFDSHNTLLLDFTGVHFGDWANEIIATHLAGIVLGEEKPIVRCGTIIKVTKSLISDIIPGVNLYSARLETIGGIHRDAVCGAVVMACNPFTNGHKYLIEYASACVEHLYVLIVQEEKFEFSFNERLSLVKKGMSHLSNVTVIPSGKFVISNITFGDYFSRSTMQEDNSRPDAVLDLLIFASFIGPSLNVSMRFVGEEPLCSVTRSYNEQMKRILPEYGCSVIEIPRLMHKEKIVSASLVRKYIKERNLSAIKPLVPKQTFDYLIEKFW